MSRDVAIPVQGQGYKSQQLNSIRPGLMKNFKMSHFGRFFYTEPILYIWGTQNVKDVVFSFKTLDLVVVQSSATNLTNLENPKSIKGNRRPKFSDGPPKINLGT